MYYPDLNEFLKLSAKGNLIPVYKEINADLDTPVSAYLKIGKDDYAFLLESVVGQEKIARYSFLGTKPAVIFKSKGRDIEITDTHHGKVRRFRAQGNPLEEIRKIMREFKPVPVKGLPRFFGGLVGYIGYDVVRFFEKLPDKNKDDLKLPDAVLLLTDSILAFDHINHTIKIIYNVVLPPDKKFTRKDKIEFYRRAISRIEAIHRQLRGGIPGERGNAGRGSRVRMTSNFTKEGFCRMVSRAKKYIRRGDIIQVVLSQRFRFKIKKPWFEIYRSLRSINPSPYMFFLKLKDFALIGSSPEILVRSQDGQVQARPIAGTRPRGKNEEEDLRFERELLKDAKERAEHIMLVDLGRNDLGRVCRTGKIEVDELMGVERYSHVMHLVTNVKGTLERRYDACDVLRACFPAGTVSGSPKVRAMEIIEELEDVRRGPYAGCVAYFSFSGNMDTCITLRTILARGKTAYIQAGAGIVADSVPAKEYRETVNKAKALIEALTK
ncbi:MAG: anthranilate synthase component I [Candidatus Omnitrophota bacterium]